MFKIFLAVNIMWDRRVVRGNTYAAQVLPATAVPDPVELQKEAEEMNELGIRKLPRDDDAPDPDKVAGIRSFN